MANARQRAADRRTRRRAFHLARIDAAPTLVEKLEASFDLLRSDLINTSDTDRAHAVGRDVVAHLIAQSDRIPRRTS